MKYFGGVESSNLDDMSRVGPSDLSPPTDMPESVHTELRFQDVGLLVLATETIGGIEETRSLNRDVVRYEFVHRVAVVI